MQAKDYFNNNADSYINLANWASDENLIDLSIHMIGKLENEIVAELGAGDCQLIKKINAKNKLALDIAINMLNRCDDHSLIKINSDILLMPIKDYALDVIICRQIIHYCDLEKLFCEISRVLNDQGLLHIIQIIDYDSVPEYIYDYWKRLRGIKGRRRVSRGEIKCIAEKNKFQLSEEQFYFLDCTYSWTSFFLKNNVPLMKQKAVKDYFADMDPDIKSNLRMKLDGNIIKYTRKVYLAKFNLLEGKHNERVLKNYND